MGLPSFWVESGCLFSLDLARVEESRGGRHGHGGAWRHFVRIALARSFLLACGVGVVGCCVSATHPTARVNGGRRSGDSTPSILLKIVS